MILSEPLVKAYAVFKVFLDRGILSYMFVSYGGFVVTGWEVAGEYIYTTPSNQDSDYMMLTLTVPGYR